MAERLVQNQGFVGWLVARMIGASVRKSFRRVLLKPPETPLNGPVVLCANHHGWFDGYLMHLLVQRLHLPTLLWVEEFGQFPAFGKVGAMPFPVGDPAARASTIRKTVRMMKRGWSLAIFPEGVLHRPPELLDFGRALEFVERMVPGVPIRPVGMVYETSLHQRPEAWISVGEPVSPREAASGVQNEISRIRESLANKASWDLLWDGTPDINERRQLPKFLRR